MTRRIFVDVTRTAREATYTGIQKVVRSAYRALAREARSRGVQVIPVILRETEAYALPELPDHPYEHEAGGGAPATPQHGLLARLRASAQANAEQPLVKAGRSLLRLALKPYFFLRYRLEPLRLGQPVAFTAGDVLLLPDSAWVADPWPVVARVKAARGRVATIWYDIIPITHPEFFSPALVEAFGAYLDKTLAQSDAVICISATVRDEVRAQAVRRGRDPGKVGHLYPIVQVAKPAAMPRQELAAAFTRPTVLIVATIEPRKGHGLLLDACDLLWRAGCDFDLLVIGRVGWQVGALLARFRDHPENGKRLQLLHDASDADIAYALGRAALMVFPSRAEGLGLPILEAEMAGCPTLCSDIAVFREIASPQTRFFATFEPQALAAAMRPLLAEDEISRTREALAQTPRPDASAAYGAALLTMIEQGSTPQLAEKDPVP